MKTIKPNHILVFLLLISILPSGNCFAQEKYGDLIIGDKIHYESKVLNERKTVIVIPSFNYKDNPEEKFPVVYVLDVGNNLFAVYGIVNYYCGAENHAADDHCWDRIH
ncbi:MAG: hypothetical protein WC699_10535 [Bacteroidales bacterium]|jgi:hypothetical protein